MSAPGRRPQGDEGSVMLLVLGFSVVLVMLLVLVVDVSHVLLAQRGVASAADGAAVAAAQELREDVFYGKGLGSEVPLDEGLVVRRVAAYQAQLTPPTDLRASVDGAGTTVTVQAERVVQLTFGRYVGRGQVTVRSVARATSPVVG